MPKTGAIAVAIRFLEDMRPAETFWMFGKTSFAASIVSSSLCGICIFAEIGFFQRNKLCYMFGNLRAVQTSAWGYKNAIYEKNVGDLRKRRLRVVEMREAWLMEDRMCAIRMRVLRPKRRMTFTR